MARVNKAGRFGLLAILVAAVRVGGETMVLPDKTVKREFRVNRQYTVRVEPGRASEAWLPVVMSFWGATHWQVVKEYKVEYSQKPDVVEQAADSIFDAGRRNHLVWNAPTGDTIEVRETIEVELSCFKALYTKAKYPYDAETLAPYGSLLKSDPQNKINLENPALDAICADVIRKGGDAEEVVESVCDWINENIKFVKGDRSSDEALEQRQGSCTPMSRLACSILRKLGIPTAVVGAKFLGSDSGHSYIEVYYPDAGWVFYDLSNRERGFKSPDCWMSGGYGYRAGPSGRPEWGQGYLAEETDLKRYADPFNGPGRVIRKGPRGLPCWGVEVHKGRPPETVRLRRQPIAELNGDLSIPPGAREYSESSSQPVAKNSTPSAVAPLSPPPSAVLSQEAPAAPANMRMWTSRVGTVVEARLASRTADSVVLERRNGARVSVKIADFSDADQTFLKTQP